jgi:hypothetical protein
MSEILADSVSKTDIFRTLRCGGSMVQLKVIRSLAANFCVARRASAGTNPAAALVYAASDVMKVFMFDRMTKDVLT